VISIADLNDLAANPQVAYDGYQELRAAARARNGGMADPADIPRYREVISRRGGDWCQSVLGKPMLGGLGSISAADADMLLIADQRGLEPPKPAWLAQWQAESDQARREREERRATALQLDREVWDAALAACKVPVEVRPNVHGRRYGVEAADGPLRHVVPLQDARSPKRLHRAGRALCEATRTPRQLGELTGLPATCKACVRYTAEIRPAINTGHRRAQAAERGTAGEERHPGPGR